MFSRFPLQPLKIGWWNSPVTPGAHVLRRTMRTDKTWKRRQLHPCCIPSPCWRIARVQVSWDSWPAGNLQHPRITVPGHRARLGQLGEENARRSVQHRKHHPYTGCQHPEEQLPPAQVLPVALQFGWALLELHNQALIILLVLRWLFLPEHSFTFSFCFSIFYHSFSKG